MVRIVRMVQAGSHASPARGARVPTA